MPVLNIHISSLLLLYKPKVAKIRLTQIFSSKLFKTCPSFPSGLVLLLKSKKKYIPGMTKLTINIFWSAKCSCFFSKNPEHQQNRTVTHWTRVQKRKADFNNQFQHESCWMPLEKAVLLLPHLLWKIFLPQCYINRVLEQQWVVLNRSCLLYLGQYFLCLHWGCSCGSHRIWPSVWAAS